MNKKLRKIISQCIDEEIVSFRKLGLGEAHLNYLIKTENKKLLCRVNISEHQDKSKIEFDSLKKIAKYGFSPEVVLYIEKNQLPYNICILEFIEGKQFRIKKRDYSKRQIKELAQLLKQIHSLKPNINKGIDFLKDFENIINYDLNQIKKLINNNKIIELLKESKKEVSKIIIELRKYDTTLSLVHGDICPQNIIETKTGKLKLIDWENISLNDPATELSHLFTDMRFNKEQMKMFREGYDKENKCHDLFIKAELYSKIFFYEYLVYEILKTLQIKNKLLDEEYLKKNTSTKHLNEAVKMFNICLKQNLIPIKWKNYDLKKEVISAS